MKPIIHLIAVSWLAVGLAGCPGTKRRTLVPDVPTSGDSTARARFQEARSHFERDGVANTSEFKAIADEYPDDPIASYALLYAGIAAFNDQDHETAREHLQALDDDPGADRRLRTRGRLFLGMSLTRLGRYDLAVQHLRDGERAVQGTEERDRFTAHMAEALIGSQTPLSSLPYFNRWYGNATPAEKAYITSRLQTLSVALDAEQAARAFRDLDTPSSPAGAVLGARVATDARNRGAIDEAVAIEAAIETMRATMGLAHIDSTATRDAGDPDLVAAVLSLTGRRARVGAPAIRALSLAAGTFPDARPTDLRSFQLSVHDTASSPSGARAGFEASAHAGAIAVIGLIDKSSLAAVESLARDAGVPTLSLNLRSGRRASTPTRFLFHIQRSAEDRAESLARHAIDNDVQKVAILRPKNGYGRAVAKAFRAQFERRGGTITRDIEYDTKATSYGAVIRKLGGDFQAVFIPDRASRLELITPALAAADLRVRPLQRLRRAGKSRRRDPGRAIGLLSTAELVGTKYLRSSGRYSVGAVFAPGFFPDRDDPLIRQFVDRYEIAFGRPPTPLDAYAYDAAKLVRTVIDEGASTRAQVAEALARVQLPSLTGTIAFDANHKRSDDGIRFVVARKGGAYTIRAMR